METFLIVLCCMLAPVVLAIVSIGFDHPDQTSSKFGDRDEW